MCVLSLAAALLTAAAVMLGCCRFFFLREKSALQNQCARIAAQANSWESFFSGLNTNILDCRLTRISREGLVLFDSEADSLLENHASRPEVAEALRMSRGEDIRRSATTGRWSYYYALLLEDGGVLRLSRDIPGVSQMLTDLLPVIGVVLLAVFVLCLLAARRLAGNILRPLAGMGGSLENLEEECCYEELAPLMAKLSRQGKRLRQQLLEAEEDKNAVSLIIRHMSEGIVLINRDRKILTANPGALSCLGAGEGDYAGKELSQLCEDVRLQRTVDRALSGEGGSGILRAADGEDGRELRFFASPVLTGQDKPKGAVLILLDATEEIREERSRREFSANLSHEMKGPLDAILQSAKAMRDSAWEDEEEAASLCGGIYEACRHLLNIIESVTRLSKVEENEAERDFVKVNLYTLTRGVCSAIAPTAIQNDITVSVTGKNVTVEGDLTMLYELISSLVDNAVQYNRPEGEVNVNVREEAGHAILTVADTGAGIPAECQERVFERFYRVERPLSGRARTKRGETAGLGLAIAKRVVEYHGGSISLKSRERIGTTVTVILEALE